MTSKNNLDSALRARETVRSYGLMENIKKSLEERKVIRAQKAKERDYSSRAESQDRGHSTMYSHMKTHDNSMHRDYYLHHHPKLVKDYAEANGLSHHHAAIDMATHASDSYIDHFRNHPTHQLNHSEHRRLGNSVVRDFKEDLRYR